MEDVLVLVMPFDNLKLGWNSPKPKVWRGWGHLSSLSALFKLKGQSSVAMLCRVKALGSKWCFCPFALISIQTLTCILLHRVKCIVQTAQSSASKHQCCFNEIPRSHQKAAIYKNSCVDGGRRGHDSPRGNLTWQCRLPILPSRDSVGDDQLWKNFTNVPGQELWLFAGLSPTMGNSGLWHHPIVPAGAKNMLGFRLLNG